MCVTDKVWCVFEGPCHYFFQFVLQQITGFLRVVTAGAQLGIFEFEEQILHLGLQDCWKYGLAETEKRIIYNAVHLAGVCESTCVPATQGKEGGAGQGQMGLFYHYTCMEIEN